MMLETQILGGDNVADTVKVAKFFGRLGTKAILNEKIAEAQKVGAIIIMDSDVGTCSAILGKTVLFRAIQKGDADAWIIMYNPEVYQKEGV